MTAQDNQALFIIDPDSVVPLYHQIKQNLRDLIDNDILMPEQLIPSERELSDLYDVNRLTVRQALSELVREGILKRQRGVGTFVASPKITQTLAQVKGFSERIKEIGHRPASKVLSFHITQAPVAVARRLGLASRAPVYQLVRMRYADNDPVMLETAYLAQEMFPGLLDVDFTNQSLYKVLADRYDCRVLEADETLEPVIMTRYETEMLDAEPGTPGLLVESVAYDQDGRAIELGRSIVRGDKSRFYFRVKRHPEQ